MRKRTAEEREKRNKQKKKKEKKKKKGRKSRCEQMIGKKNKIVFILFFYVNSKMRTEINKEIVYLQPGSVLGIMRSGVMQKK